MIKKIIATVIMLAIIVGGSMMTMKLTKIGSSSNEGKLTVAASYYPLYDFAKQVGGDRVSVTNMTPAGAEPHDYEPSPKALIAAHESAVFISNGEQMEPWVGSFLSDYKHTVVKASQDILLYESDGEDHDHESEHEHAEHSSTDPHFWLDPVLAQQVVKNIRDGFSKADPENSAFYEARANSYIQKLAELDQRFSERLSGCNLDTVVSSHSAFSYVARRYGFVAIPIAGIEPQDEPSPVRMAELTDIVKQRGIKYIFFESLVSPRLADTIAREAGVGTLIFDPLEGLSEADQNKGRDYISVQYDNLENLQRALDCK